MTDNPKGATTAEPRWEICAHCGHDMKNPCSRRNVPNEVRNCHWNQEYTRVLGTGMVNNRPTPAAAAEIVPLTDEREAFETWLREHRFDPSEQRPGEYLSVFTRYAWIAWQARAAIATQAAPKDSKDLGVSPAGPRSPSQAPPIADAACGDPRRHLTAEDCARLLPKSKAEAIAFLKSAGILTPDGGLSPNYYSPEQIAAHGRTRGGGDLPDDYEVN